MIAGGAEAAVCHMGIGGFGALRALSTRNDDPSRASRPFDKDRDGFVLGEGAGILILEELEFARRRGAHDLRGVCRLRHVRGRVPHDRAARGRRRRSAGRCRMRCESAGVQPDEVDYINAHGTSTPHNDRIETLAVKTRVRRSRAHARDLVDQVDDRPPAGRRRRPRGRHHRAGDSPPAGAADDQSRRARRRLRPGLRRLKGAAR